MTQSGVARIIQSAATVRLEYEPIGGIPVHHVVPADWNLHAGLTTAWSASAPSDEPLVVEHFVGSLEDESLEHRWSVASNHFFENQRGQTVIQFAPRPRTVTTHAIETVEGAHFRLLYSERPADLVYPYLRDRLLYTVTLPARRLGVVAHALGFRNPRTGAGVLCPGRSGAGKSTLSTLLRRAEPSIELLSDDRVIVRSSGSGLVICGTPWPSRAEASSPSCVPVKAIVFLRHATERRVREIGAREAMGKLLQCLSLPYWSEPQLGIALEWLDALIERMPVLECSYDVDVRSAEWLLGILDSAIDG